MNKILLLITMAVVATMASSKVYAVEPTVTSAPLWAVYAQSANIHDDVRIKALENVLRKYNSPLVSQASNYVNIADKNGVDWKLLPSIAGLESTFGQHLIDGTHNAYGWGSGHIYFNSWEEGIDIITASLKDRYYARGADTVDKIGPIYAESPTWAVRVNKFMAEIEAEYKRIQAEELPITI